MRRSLARCMLRQSPEELVASQEYAKIWSYTLPNYSRPLRRIPQQNKTLSMLKNAWKAPKPRKVHGPLIAKLRRKDISDKEILAMWLTSKPPKDDEEFSLFAGRALRAAVRCKKMQIASKIIDTVDKHPSKHPYPYLLFSKTLCEFNRQKGALEVVKRMFKREIHPTGAFDPIFDFAAQAANNSVTLHCVQAYVAVAALQPIGSLSKQLSYTLNNAIVTLLKPSVPDNENIANSTLNDVDQVFLAMHKLNIKPQYVAISAMCREDWLHAMGPTRLLTLVNTVEKSGRTHCDLTVSLLVKSCFQLNSFTLAMSFLNRIRRTTPPDPETALKMYPHRAFEAPFRQSKDKRNQYAPTSFSETRSMRNSSTESLQNLDLYSGMIGPLTLEVLFGEAMKRENLAMALNTWAELRGSWLHPSAKVCLGLMELAGKLRQPDLIWQVWHVYRSVVRLKLNQGNHHDRPHTHTHTSSSSSSSSSSSPSSSPYTEGHLVLLRACQAVLDSPTTTSSSSSSSSPDESSNSDPSHDTFSNPGDILPVPSTPLVKADMITNLLNNFDIISVSDPSSSFHSHTQTEGGIGEIEETASIPDLGVFNPPSSLLAAGSESLESPELTNGGKKNVNQDQNNENQDLFESAEEWDRKGERAEERGGVIEAMELHHGVGMSGETIELLSELLLTHHMGRKPHEIFEYLIGLLEQLCAHARQGVCEYPDEKVYMTVLSHVTSADQLKYVEDLFILALHNKVVPTILSQEAFNKLSETLNTETPSGSSSSFQQLQLNVEIQKLSQLLQDEGSQEPQIPEESQESSQQGEGSGEYELEAKKKEIERSVKEIIKLFNNTNDSDEV